MTGGLYFSARNNLILCEGKYKHAPPPLKSVHSTSEIQLEPGGWKLHKRKFSLDHTP